MADSSTPVAGSPAVESPASSGARGKVTAVKDGVVVFVPANSNYELSLLAPKYAGPVDQLIRGRIRVTARKILTVPSGGNFIAPIFGPPRTIQGRVRSIAPNEMVVHAGAEVVVELPKADSAFDLNHGPISVGTIVNVTALPGARFELL